MWKKNMSMEEIAQLIERFLEGRSTVLWARPPGESTGPARSCCCCPFERINRTSSIKERITEPLTKFHGADGTQQTLI
jgi:hypothetical protein